MHHLSTIKKGSDATQVTTVSCPNQNIYQSQQSSVESQQKNLTSRTTTKDKIFDHNKSTDEKHQTYFHKRHQPFSEIFIKVQSNLKRFIQTRGKLVTLFAPMIVRS